MVVNTCEVVSSNLGWPYDLELQGCGNNLNHEVGLQIYLRSSFKCS